MGVKPPCVFWAGVINRERNMSVALFVWRFVLKWVDRAGGVFNLGV